MVPRVTVLLLAVTGRLLVGADSGPRFREAAAPKWTVHLFHVDHTAIVRLNGEPVLITGPRQEFSGGIAPAAGSNLLTLEFDAAPSSDHGSYGYRVDVDGHVLMQGECGFGCPAMRSPIPGRPTTSGTPQNQRAIHSATLRFIYYKVPGTIPLPLAAQVAGRWAAAAGVLLSWQEGRIVSAREAANRAGPRFANLWKNSAAPEAAEFEQFIQALQLVPVGSEQPGTGRLQRLLESHGPVWVPSTGRILYAITGDGSDEHTYVSSVDVALGIQKSESVGEVEKQNGSGVLLASGTGRLSRRRQP